MLNRRRLLPVPAYPGIACRVWYPSDGCARKWLKILRPFFDGAAGTINAEEQAFVQEIATHTAGGGRDIAVLPRLSRCDVVPLDLVMPRRAALSGRALSA
jgi:hypothetical protein